MFNLKGPDHDKTKPWNDLSNMDSYDPDLDPRFTTWRRNQRISLRQKWEEQNRKLSFLEKMWDNLIYFLR